MKFFIIIHLIFQIQAKILKQNKPHLGKQDYLQDRIKQISKIIKSNKKHDKQLQSSRKNLFRKLQNELGPLAFNSWKLKLQKSGINLEEMNLQELRDLTSTTHQILFDSHKKNRKLGLPLPEQPNYNNMIDINTIKGGDLAVRFPNTPQAIVVNQNPYYSYTQLNLI